MFSTNQVRHLLVATSVSQRATYTLFKGDAAANQVYVCAADGNQYATAQKQIAFKVYNDKGLVTTSDVIDVDNITYIKALGYLPSTLSVTSIAPGTVENSSYYELKITMNNWGSLSAEDQYFRIAGYTTAASGDDQENIVDGLIQAMAKTLSQEQPSKGETFTYTKKGGSTVVLPVNPYFTLSKSGSTATAKVVLTEKAQDYVVGKKQARPLNYTATIISDAADAVVTTTASNKGLGAGKDVKDLEWFSKGYRGDIYRGMGYPNNFEESYVADTSKGYNILEISYYYRGNNEQVQRSEKTLTIAVESSEVDFAQYLVAPLYAMIGTKVGVISPTGEAGVTVGGIVNIVAAGTSDTVTFYPTTGTYSILSTLPSWANDSSNTAFSSNTLTVDCTANATGSTRTTDVTIGHSSGATYILRISQVSS